MLFCHMGIFFAWLFQDFLIDCISVDKSLGTTLEGRSILLEVWEYKPAKPSQGDGSGPGEFERLQTGSQPRLHQEAGYHLFKWLKEKKDFNIIIFHSSEIQKWKALKPLHLKTSEAGSLTAFQVTPNICLKLPPGKKQLWLYRLALRGNWTSDHTVTSRARFWIFVAWGTLTLIPRMRQGWLYICSTFLTTVKKAGA